MNQVEEDLLKLQKPRLLIVGEINVEMYKHVARSLSYLTARNSPPVTIVIDSGGGDVDYGLNIYDLIRLYEGETTGLVIRRAASMAAIILQACNKRQCAKNAEVLIHYVSRRNVSLSVLEDDVKRQKLIEEMRRQQKRIHNILKEKTNKPDEEIITQCGKDDFMSAQQSKDFGLVDDIS